MSLQELQRQSFRVQIDGTPFDVPVLYHYNAYDKRHDRWPTPTLAERIGLRRSVDTLQFVALLPNMEPYSQVNAGAFSELGHGRRVRVSVMPRTSNRAYYFSHVFPRLHQSDDGLLLPGFRRYEDRLNGQVLKITYLNHEEPSDDLVIIECGLKGSATSPSCWVTAPYRRHLQVTYYFGLSHLQQWPVIHGNLNALLDHFNAAPPAR